MGKIGDFICKDCDAYLWKGEKLSICCSSRQIRRTGLSDLGDIKSLYDWTSKQSERFLHCIVGFNILFCFTSFTTSSKLENASETAVCYKINGKVYHPLMILDPELMLDGMTTEDFLKRTIKEPSRNVYGGLFNGLNQLIRSSDNKKP
ncbi:hypothetical protein Pmani_032001 [Petrolisthes manimaculis]|uniref:Uncharacterized protein n=1 Tax=Petrolisthes manimaculis TaxID=1843537 RepID=A0AAE1TS26_9EUCA|nr:hypothetical protein Pmani_032001 [Petrolisthes manimaculis]